MNWYKIASENIRLWLDDERNPNSPEIQAQYGAQGNEVWVKTVDEAINYLKQGNVEHLSFDNDLGEGEKEGHLLANWIEEQAYLKQIPRLQWNVHSQNPPASAVIVSAMTQADKFWDMEHKDDHETI